MTNLRTGKCFNFIIYIIISAFKAHLNHVMTIYVLDVMDPKFKSSLELWDITRARTYQATVMATNVLVCDPRP